MNSKHFHIALVGNPNSGKTSLFNRLTGLNQKVGNFPGVTVDKKTGQTLLAEGQEAILIDLPGSYSLYPKRSDEWVSYRVLMGQDTEVPTDMVLLVVDAANLKRNLLFVTQLIDLGKPMVVALTMTDIARSKGMEIDFAQLERELGVPVVDVNPRKGKGVTALKKVLAQMMQLKPIPAPRSFFPVHELAAAPIAALRRLQPQLSEYQALHYLINHEQFDLPETLQTEIEAIEHQCQFNPTKTQAEEILQRYGRIRQVMQNSVVEEDPLQQHLFTERLDKVLLHRVWGYVILLSVLFLLFQSVFWLAAFPMDLIEVGFGKIGEWFSGWLPATWWADLFVNGFVAGLSGIFVFVPQIMLLFGLITVLEDTGYMARISFLTDKLMRKSGLNGKSVMPMISGYACAVPAVMSARNIENAKERLLTILVTPLMSCSARLPVYTILIALVIPETRLFGFISLQGLVMMALYLLGTVVALVVSYVAKWFISIQEKSFFILELPVYRAPRWKNAGITMVQKAKIFVVDAGKVILIISMILWALSSYGPKAEMAALHKQYEQQLQQANVDEDLAERNFQAAKLEHSYAGKLGRAIEPVIAPLGYDWKIGIALITSFAAREVFVGTMATLYSVGDGEANDGLLLREKMALAKRKDGTPVYTVATGISLLLFYVFAMQCMSTLAVVKRETRSWKWPMVQLLYMTGLAYFSALLAYIVLR